MSNKYVHVVHLKNIGSFKEYSHPMFEKLVNSCDGFIVTNFEMPNPEGEILKVPRCGRGQYCYGIFKNSGTRILLRYIKGI